MKKKIISFILLILCSVLLAGCAMEYYTTEEDGNFTYALAKKKAFLAGYTWDGTEEGMKITVPKKFDGKKIVAIGGFYGRGLPMPFTVDSSAYYQADVNSGAELIQENEVDHVEKKIQLNFLVIYKGELTEGIDADTNYSEYMKLNGVITEYEYNIDIRAKKDAKNGVTPGIVALDDFDQPNPAKSDNGTTSNNDTDSPSADVQIFAGAKEEDLNIFCGNNNTLIFLNEDGSLYEKIDLKDIIPSLFGDWAGITYVGSCNHSAFFASSRNDDQAIFEYNIEKKELNRIYRGIVNYPSVKFIDGDMYVDDTVKNTATDSYEHFSYRLFRNMDGGWNCEDSLYGALNEVATTDRIDYSRSSAGNNTVFAPGYTVTKCELAVFPKDSQLLVYDIYGNVIDTLTLNDGSRYDVHGLDSKHIIYTKRDKDYNRFGLFSYDMGTKEEKCLYMEAGKERLEVLDYVDSVAYVGLITEPGVCQSVTEIKAFPADGGEPEDVGRVESKPGHYVLDYPVDYAFKIMGNTAVYAGETENSTGLLCSIKSGDKWVQKDLEIPYKVYDYTEYATMKSQSYSVICPYCNKYDALEYYYEYPEIKSSVPNADKISQIIADEAKKSYDSNSDYTVDYTEEDCKGYLHSDYENSNIFWSKVMGIDVVMDHYLCISREGYDMYIGSIHGMYYTTSELFDISSGEKVSFKDIYRGSEDEFKEIVARAAQEQFQNDPDFAESVFATDDVEMYRSVLEYIKLDWESFTFYDDYLTVDFEPYMLGSYADGIVSVKVTYDRLGL